MAALLDKLRSLVGPAHVLAGVDCSPYVLEGRTPEAVVFPGSKEEIGAILTLAAEHEVPVLPWGGGTALGVGASPSRVGLVLGLKRLNRVLEHEPGDLTTTVESRIVDGNNAVTVLSLEGTHIGEFLGIPPTGKRFMMPAVFFYQLENGKIVRERRIYDFTGLLVQIGVLKAKPA